MEQVEPKKLDEQLQSCGLSLYGGENECVWHTVAKLLDKSVDEVKKDTGFTLTPGLKGIHADAVKGLLRANGKKFHSRSIDVDIPEFEKYLQKHFGTDVTKHPRVGVCYTRPGGVGHCVVYEPVVSRHEKAGLRFVDDSPNTEEDVLSDVQKSKIKLIFYLREPKTAPDLPPQEDLRNASPASRQGINGDQENPRTASAESRRGTNDGSSLSPPEPRSRHYRQSNESEISDSRTTPRRPLQEAPRNVQPESRRGTNDELSLSLSESRQSRHQQPNDSRQRRHHQPNEPDTSDTRTVPRRPPQEGRRSASPASRRGTNAESSLSPSESRQSRHQQPSDSRQATRDQKPTERRRLPLR